MPAIIIHDQFAREMLTRPATSFIKTKEQRDALCYLIKHLPLTPKKLLPIEEAIVTAGGVNIKEIVPQTMESKRCRGLYFAGEVLDLDAKTGGFNLQIAFSTGFVAGESAGKGVL